MLENWLDERNNAALYRIFAEAEANPQLAEVFRRMAEVEENHAAVWARKMKEAGFKTPAFKLSWRTRTLGWVARRFGVETVLPTVIGMEQRADNTYSGQAKGESEILHMQQQENSHARLLNQISVHSSQGVEGSALARMEGRHRAAGGNALRAAVLGANDGLVSNLSLVMGVAGASLASREIMVTGLAGLLAGACSMALGEWLSVQSSRELYAHQIKVEANEIAAAPEEETEELSLIYQARGVAKEQADALAHQVMSDPSTAVEAKVREELSLDTKELGGSAWEAAITSFVLFTIGAIVPVSPFILFTGQTAITASVIFSTFGLFIIGAGITLFTGRPVWISGLRQVVFGLAAAALTYGIGLIIGVNLGG